MNRPVFYDAAVSMACILAEADIGYYHHVRQFGLYCPDRSLYSLIIIKCAGTYGILFFREPEENDGLNPKLH